MKRFISIVLAVAMAFGLVFAHGVNAAPVAENIDVEIEQSDTVAEIQARIQDAIDTVADGGTVTVTGSKTNAGSNLSLTIPENKTVIWKAIYSGNFVSNGVRLSGDGTFDVAEYGAIMFTLTGGYVLGNRFANDRVTIRVSGGVVSNIVNDFALGGIYVIAGRNGDVEVIDGLVVAGGGGGQGGLAAIWSHNGNITVSGGVVTGLGAFIDVIRSDNGNITMSGGEVIIDGAYITAIRNYNGNIVLLTGIISGWSGWINTGANALAIRVDTLVIPRTRDGTSEGLTLISRIGAPFWDLSGEAPKIQLRENLAIEWGVFCCEPEDPCEDCYVPCCEPENPCEDCYVSCCEPEDPCEDCEPVICELCEACRKCPCDCAPPPPPWWTGLHVILQWILRWIFFGWIWM